MFGLFKKNKKQRIDLTEYIFQKADLNYGINEYGKELLIRAKAVVCVDCCVSYVLSWFLKRNICFSEEKKSLESVVIYKHSELNVPNDLVSWFNFYCQKHDDGSLNGVEVKKMFVEKYLGKDREHECSDEALQLRVIFHYFCDVRDSLYLYKEYLSLNKNKFDYAHSDIDTIVWLLKTYAGFFVSTYDDAKIIVGVMFDDDRNCKVNI